MLQFQPLLFKINRTQEVLKMPSSQQAKSMWAVTLQITILFNSLLLCCTQLILLDPLRSLIKFAGPEGRSNHAACFHPFAYKRESENWHKSLQLQTGDKYVQVCEYICIIYCVCLVLQHPVIFCLAYARTGAIWSELAPLQCNNWSVPNESVMACKDAIDRYGTVCWNIHILHACIVLESAIMPKDSFDVAKSYHAYSTLK